MECKVDGKGEKGRKAREDRGYSVGEGGAGMENGTLEDSFQGEGGIKGRLGRKEDLTRR